MSELVAKTNVPKSTILYYIREGLLPQAIKVKSNLHKYDDEHIELIKYIKYMKDEMGSSIDEIKLILKNKNDSFSSSYSMLAPLMNTLSGESTTVQHYTRSEFIEHFDINEKLLDQLLKDDILMPLGEDTFTQKEASIINLVESFIEVGVDYNILNTYVKHAVIISELEQKMQKDLCKVKNEDNFSTLWKIMFETLFSTKEYVFNRSTHKVMQQSLRDELKK
jgi:DNA-binding transcriptional MerR regulator